MPDQYGRLNREEMRETVRRRVDAIRADVNTTTGAETSILQLDPLVTNEDINTFLNTAVIKRAVDVNIADNTIMADQELVDIVAGVAEYVLPGDMMFLRGLYWLPPMLQPSTVTQSIERAMMYEADINDSIDQTMILGWDIPTYRRRLNMFVLNQIPQQNNPQGVLVDYVKHFLILAADDQYIETPLAPIIQEICILDVVIEIVTTRMQIDVSQIRENLAALEQRLALAIVNYHAPKTIIFQNPITMVQPPFGRRSVGWIRRSWWGRSWG